MTKTPPPNKCVAAERDRVPSTINSDKFVNKSALQVYATLLTRGEYLCSATMMFRVLRVKDNVRERRDSASRPPRKLPELMAGTPGQVYSCDITKLPNPVKGVYFHACMMIAIFSRYTVGAVVHAGEEGLRAKHDDA